MADRTSAPFSGSRSSAAVRLRCGDAPRWSVKVHDDAEGHGDELEKTRVVSSNGLGRRLAETDDLPSPPDLHERLRRELEREGDAGNGAGHGVPASDELGSGETAAAADESEEQRPRRRRPWLDGAHRFHVVGWRSPSSVGRTCWRWCFHRK